MLVHAILLALTFGNCRSAIWDKVFPNMMHTEAAELIVNMDVFLDEESNASNETMKLPYVLCGPLLDKEVKELDLSSTLDGLYHPVLLDEDDRSICYLVHATLSQITSLLSENWISKKLPEEYKIHPSVLRALSENMRATPNTLNDLSPTLGGEGESFMLVVEYIRGGDMQASVITTNILAQWSQKSEMKHRSSPQWSETRSPYHHPDDSVCALPPAVSIENDAYASRIADLSYFLTNKHCLYLLVSMMARHNHVLSISVQSRPVLLNYDAKGVVQSGVPGWNSFHDQGITGKNQIVGIADSGLNDYSCFFYDNSLYYSDARTTRTGMYSSAVEKYRRKVIQYISYADGSDVIAGHGTHVAGTIVGNSIFDGYSGGDGVAPDSKIAFYDVQNGNSPYLSIPDLNMYVLKTQYNAGARVMSHSWGSNTEVYYTERSYDVDYFLFNNPDTLVIFAAGNSGNYGLKTVYTPCSSKNVLCVGSADLRDDVSDDISSNTQQVSYFSSLGPTFDNRIKPDLLSSGFKTMSALSGESSSVKSCGVGEQFGTSMAAPVVAGAALLARDYFLNHWENYCNSEYLYCKSFTPSGYLLKAVLLHASSGVKRYSSSNFNDKTDIASFNLGKTPDVYQGYGLLSLSSVLPLSTSLRKEQDLFIYDKLYVNAYSEAKFTVKVYDSSKPLRVTIAWYDPPSAMNTASKLLLNNFDLLVYRSGTGNGWHGNKGGNSETDVYNPQEQVIVDNPSDGEYEVVIMANALTKDIPLSVVISCHGYVHSGISTAEVRTTLSLSNNNLIESLGNHSQATDTNIKSASPLPMATNYVAQIDRSFDLTLSPLQMTCLEPFIIPYANLLHSVTLNLDGTNTGGSSAFVFAVIVTTPNGETLQLGGYQQLYTSSRTWFRLWPVQWTGGAAGGSGWSSLRVLEEARIAQAGQYDVCVALMHKSWSETYYKGSVVFSFVDETQSAPSPTPGVQHSSGNETNESLQGASLFAIVFILGFVAVIGVLLVSRKRQDVIGHRIITMDRNGKSLSAFQRSRRDHVSVLSRESDIENVDHATTSMNYLRKEGEDDDRRLIVGSVSSSL